MRVAVDSRFAGSAGHFEKTTKSIEIKRAWKFARLELIRPRTFFSLRVQSTRLVHHWKNKLRCNARILFKRSNKPGDWFVVCSRLQENVCYFRPFDTLCGHWLGFKSRHTGRLCRSENFVFQKIVETGSRLPRQCLGNGVRPRSMRCVRGGDLTWTPLQHTVRTRFIEGVAWREFMYTQDEVGWIRTSTSIMWAATKTFATLRCSVRQLPLSAKTTLFSSFTWTKREMGKNSGLLCVRKKAQAFPQSVWKHQKPFHVQQIRAPEAGRYWIDLSARRWKIGYHHAWANQAISCIVQYVPWTTCDLFRNNRIERPRICPQSNSSINRTFGCENPMRNSGCRPVLPRRQWIAERYGARKPPRSCAINGAV